MKIAITTFYYKVYNYGANLQAYALVRVLQKMGYDAEQLCFNTSDGFPKYKLPFLKNIEIGIKVFFAECFAKIRHLKYFILYKRRLKACDSFLKEKIPHSNRIYNLHNIAEAQKVYDLFITGSDVVWSPVTNSPIFFFRFLDKKTPKLAYAPSLGTDKLSKLEKEQFRRDLESFMDISIREKRVVPIVADACGKKVQHCVDSTLLLDEGDWNEICSYNLINRPYIFCYFLGNNLTAKKLAISYAKKYNLLVVNIPYYWKRYSEYSDFGDIKLSKISASEFLSLIKYAQCVFTDSFHACVFSEIFRTHFFAFSRGNNDKLSIRLVDFLTESGAIEYYCQTEKQMSLEYLNSLKIPNFDEIHKKLSELRNPSILYLKKNLEKVVS